MNKTSTIKMVHLDKEVTTSEKPQVVRSAAIAREEKNTSNKLYTNSSEDDVAASITVSSKNINNLPVSANDEQEEKIVDAKNKSTTADSYEAQENVHSTVLAEPPSAVTSSEEEMMISKNNNTLTGCCDDETTQADQEIGEASTSSNQEQEDEMERRFFMSSGGLTEEVKKFRNQRNRLLSKAHLKKIKKEKKGIGVGGGKKRGVSLAKSSLSGRQSSSTVGYESLQQEWAQQLQQQQQLSGSAQNVATSHSGSSLKPHFPSLQFSHLSTVQKLLLDKLHQPNLKSHQQQNLLVDNPFQAASASSNHFFPASHHYAAAGNFASGSSDALRVSAWHGKDTFPSLKVASNLHGAKMIPIEIIGLDPQVVKSILQSDSGDTSQLLGDNPSSSAHNNLFSHLGASGMGLAPTGALGLKRDRVVPSIVHIHHFHTQTKPPAQPPDGSLAASLQRPRAYVNDKGELVYLPAGESANGASVSGTNFVHEHNRAIGSDISMIESTGDLPGAGEQQATGLHRQQQQNQVLLEQQELTQQPATAGGGLNGDLSIASLQPAMDSRDQKQQATQQFDSAMSNAQLALLSKLHNTGHPEMRFAQNSLSKPLEQSGKQRVYLTTNGQTISVISRPNLHQLESSQNRSPDDESKMLMVAYKPQQVMTANNSASSKNFTTNTGFANSNGDLRGEDIATFKNNNPYNEGQESKASLVSAGALVLRPLNSLLQASSGASAGYRAELPTLEQVNLELVNRIRSQSNGTSTISNKAASEMPMWPHSVIGSPKYNVSQQLTTSNFSMPSSSNRFQHDGMENRVPFDSQALRLMSQHLTRQNNNYPFFSSIAAGPNNDERWKMIMNSQHNPNGGSEHFGQQQLKGYNAGKLFPVAGFKNNSISVTSSADSNLLIQPFLKHFAVGSTKQQLLSQITNPPNGTEARGAGLNNEELMRKLLRELKIKSNSSNNNNNSNNNNFSSADTVLPSNSNNLIFTHQQMLPAEPSMLANGTGQPHRIIYNKDFKSSNLLETGRKTSDAFEKQQQQSASINEQPATEQQFTDTMGLSSIALAFIFVVSLLTLSIIAASLIYRHKRRSIGRCATRSRLNLTQRTKRFMRSNFVRPDHHGITPIKSINHISINHSGLNSVESKVGSSLSSLGIAKEPTNTVKGSKSVISKVANHLTGVSNEQQNLTVPQKAQQLQHQQNPNLTCRVADRYINKQTFCQPQMSTFNSSAHSSSQFTEDSTADIKTLNTRLQKSTYLKTLISTPDCSQAGSTATVAISSQAKQQNRANKIAADSNSSYIRHQSPSSPLKLHHHHTHSNHLHHHHHHPQQQLKSKNSSGGECRRSHSFKKSNSCESHLHNYTFAFKNSPFASEPGSSDRISINSKKHNNSNRMSTIHSMSENNDLKTLVNHSRESPAQLMRQNNISYRASESNNLMTPKYLVGSMPLYSHHQQSEDRLQMDRL